MIWIHRPELSSTYVARI